MFFNNYNSKLVLHKIIHWYWQNQLQLQYSIVELSVLLEWTIVHSCISRYLSKHISCTDCSPISSGATELGSINFYNLVAFQYRGLLQQALGNEGPYLHILMLKCVNAQQYLAEESSFNISDLVPEVLAVLGLFLLALSQLRCDGCSLAWRLPL
jgi:hypothetical protein